MSPWIILGALLVLVPLFVLMTREYINRQKQSTTNLLVEKGAALIRSFEAGARTGMMGMRWGGSQVQRLLTETAQQPDIIYLTVTDSKGRILAHSDPENIGKSHGAALDLKKISSSKEVRWRLVRSPGAPDTFEVYRRFSPTYGHAIGHHHRLTADDWCRTHISPGDSSRPSGQVVFVGLDMGPVESARKEDVRNSVIMAFTLLLVSFAGIMLLFLAQAYRSTKTSFYRLKAFSDSLVENMPMGLVAIGTDGRIASFNQTAESVLRISAKNALGKTPIEVLPRSLSQLVDELKDEKGIIEREIECLVKGDKTMPLEVIGTFLQEEYGEFLGYVVLFRDLTQIRHLQKEVLRSQRLASIGRLASGIAHEIRNPLSSIKGFATYFKERYKQVPEDQKTADIMIQEVDRLNRVIGQLLEFARPMQIQEKPISLQSLIHHSLKLIEADLREKSIEIKATTPSEIGVVMVDPDRFKQVLLNLYLNALEAMERGGTLSVELTRDITEKGVQIIISDTGQGIKEEDMPHIFDPYFTSKPSGTGLGLAIVLKIIESHHGKIAVNSRRGKGTTVAITLPSSEEAKLP